MSKYIPPHVYSPWLEKMQSRLVALRLPCGFNASTRYSQSCLLAKVKSRESQSRSLDSEKAIAIAYNAKTSRYAVCNAMETLLVAESRAEELLPPLAEQFAAAGVELKGCDITRRILGDNVTPATEDDWHAEYLAAVLAVRVVADLDAAIAHINHYSSAHTDTIVTENHSHGMRFVREVDSSSVMINASPRFADGFEYGLGAEIGISTDKLHARGPVGLEGLTSQKYVVFGDGQIRT